MPLYYMGWFAHNAGLAEDAASYFLKAKSAAGRWLFSEQSGRTADPQSVERKEGDNGGALWQLRFGEISGKYDYGQYDQGSIAG